MKTTKTLISAVVLVSLPLLAAENTQAPKARVIQASRFDVSPPLRDIPPVPPPAEEQEAEPILPMPVNVPPRSGPDPLLRASTPLAPGMLIPGPIANFPGLGQGFPGFGVSSAPPDTNMAVGPNHIVQTVNTSFVVLSKTGATILAPRTIQTLWSGFGGNCQATNDGDPVVQYDKAADRWVISQLSLGIPRFTPPFFECVAVSTSGDPTGSYTRYAFPYGSNVDDYPKMAVWPDGYYVSYNFFTPPPFNFLGAEVCALDRTSMLAGAPATQQCFQTGTSAGSLLPSDLDGPTPPPAGSPNYFVSRSFSGTSLSVWKFHVDWVTPANTTFTGPTILPVASYFPTCGGGTCVPQLGTSQQLDSLADRLMYRLAYRNFGDHESLVVNHSVATSGTSGSGVRWYEIRIASGTPSLFQQGTYAPDASFRWMGSIAMDAVGNMGLGFSLSSATLNPAIHYAGRFASDPIGQMPQGEGTIINGTGSQLSGLSRWGDYSAMRIDPSDDCIFWYTTEYLATNGTFNWRTQIASFELPACQMHFSVSVPTNVTAGASFNATITARDRLNNTVTGYSGTVHFTSSDPQAVLPADSALTSGVGTFPATLKTAGSQSITVNDTVVTSQTGSSAAIAVGSAPASKYAMTSPATATGNPTPTPFPISLVAQDPFNNTATNYAGTVHFTTSDPSGTPPADYAFQLSDNGQKTFSNFVLQTAGGQTITATDTVTVSITATNPITVVTDAFITPQGRSIRMFRSNVPVIVATFTDNDLTESGANLTATIDWGDGSPVDTGCSLTSTNCKIVQVTTSPNTFAVRGAHTYVKKGSFTVHVRLTDPGGSVADAFSTARFFPMNSSR